MPALLFLAVACGETTSPKRPITAITYISSNPRGLVVSSPDGKLIYATYPLPFAPSDAALSPDHSQIVMSNDGLGELWVESTADGQAQMIVGRDSGAATPSWSADGKHILFYRGTTGGVWMIDPDGNNEHPIVSDTPAFVPELDPVWSPDGSQIAFDSPFGDAALSDHLYIMNSDGSGAHLVSLPVGNTLGDSWQPTWSPDGRQLAFVRGVDTTTAIWIANVDGSGARAVATEGTPWEPTWSPSGDAIAFAVFAPSPMHVVVLDLATGRLTSLHSGNTLSTNSNPHWIRWP
jgi:Tol biopolymer transport system component